ncbi:MAG TPA: PilZ domain-containing protein [Phycisphaerales bacterium]|nr:PilZ domain-containing protein [Phycisphaerales bacterium]
MNENNERRREQRLRYHWPIWFAEDFNEALSQGQMVDVSSGGAAFTCHADENCPYPGQQVTARFSVPCFGPEGSFDMASFTRSGSICRVDNVNRFLRRVAVQFAKALPFKPGEQADSESDAQQKLKAVTI